MLLLTGLLFAIVYGIVTAIGTYLGVTNFYFYLVLSLVMMLIQYLAGPAIVDWSMRVRYLKSGEYPNIQAMVRNLAMVAKIPVPRIGISQVAVPNAFAFGRSLRDSRICVTEGLMGLLDEKELRAVLGHEMSHIKNRDVLTITLLSVIPMILYRIAWQFMFYGGDRRDREQSAALVGLVAFLFYFVTNLLVLYASRIREYFADKGSIDLGNEPAWLASALYKLVYGAARTDRESLKQVEGMKAFFANDPSRAQSELRDLRGLDLDRSGTISAAELQVLQTRAVKLGFGDRLMEILSTHPNMLKRVKRLSEWKAH
jgi:heat shock protein HtpX